MAVNESKEKAARPTYFDFGGYDMKGFEAATQTWKELIGTQLRASQMLADQTVAMTKKATDYWAAQATETLKFQQEAMRFTLGFADELRKTTFETAERTLK